MSVCLGVLEHNPATNRDLARIMTDFFDRTHWHPATREIVAGALKYHTIQSAGAMGDAAHRPQDRLTRSRYDA